MPSDDPEDDHEDESGATEADDDRLSAMMNLLEDHDDKWEESDSGDGRYRVTLPDDEVVPARTRDDVRALLFKHYD